MAEHRPCHVGRLLWGPRLPVLAAVAASLLWAATAWRRCLRDLEPTRCRRCGYDRRGLATPAIRCPNAGRLRRRSRSSAATRLATLGTTLAALHQPCRPAVCVFHRILVALAPARLVGWGGRTSGGSPGRTMFQPNNRGRAAAISRIAVVLGASLGAAVASRAHAQFAPTGRGGMRRSRSTTEHSTATRPSADRLVLE